MIGACLPLAWLEGCVDENRATGAWLRDLRARGVYQIEIDLTRTYEEERLFSVVKRLAAMGFEIAIRVALDLSDAGRSAFLRLCERLLALSDQESLTVIVSPCSGESAVLADALSRLAVGREASLLFAVEHGPHLPVRRSGERQVSVLDLVRQIDLPNVGICFDWEEELAECRLYSADGLQADLPEKDFGKHVKHAHFGGGCDREIASRMKAYLSALSYGYFGAYNVKLCFDETTMFSSLQNAIGQAVSGLQTLMPYCAQVYDDLRLRFDERLMRALSDMGTADDSCRFSLIGSSSYLFVTNGFRWAMDVAFRNAYRLCRTPHRIAELMADVKLMIISHGHADHFEERTVRSLAATEMQWVIPDFLAETALSWGIKPEKLIVAHDGEPIRVGPLTILPFPGRHFRPITGKGTQEYGYRITATGVPSLVFPVDTRDFSLNGLPQIPPSDYCFANVWLGDHGGLIETDSKVIDEYVRFMLHFSSSHLLFTHLYESKRRDEDMWRREHAEKIAQTVAAVSPLTATLIPDTGKILTLD